MTNVLPFGCSARISSWQFSFRPAAAAVSANTADDCAPVSNGARPQIPQLFNPIDNLLRLVGFFQVRSLLA
jgi:hypothetical protein